MRKIHLDFHTNENIKICDDWLEYIPFRDWALANGYEDNLTIDRVDNDGDYYPENCQWITRGENAGKDNCGEKSRFAKLINEMVRLIKQSPAISCTEFGRIFNVNKSTISSIRLNKTWKHIV